MCRAVTDHEIREAIEDGARTVDDVAQRCDEAGTVCLGCLPSIRRLLDEAHATANR
jgi:bacterioferritin-associated ferredoxin